MTGRSAFQGHLSFHPHSFSHKLTALIHTFNCFSVQHYQLNCTRLTVWHFVSMFAATWQYSSQALCLLLILLFRIHIHFVCTTHIHTHNKHSILTVSSTKTALSIAAGLSFLTFLHIKLHSQSLKGWQTTEKNVRNLFTGWTNLLGVIVK